MRKDREEKNNPFYYFIYYLIINSVRLLVLSVVGGVDTYLGKLLAKNDNKVLNDSFKK